MKKLGELLKRLYNKLFHLNGELIKDDYVNSEVEDIFKNIKYGDIIKAKRINPNNGDLKPRPGHETGPFLVLENNKDELYCLYGSSNCNHSTAKKRFIINYENYNELTKATCFYLDNFYRITRESFLKELDTLNIHDRYVLQKKINILGCCSDKLKKYVNNSCLEIGDIFEFNDESYLVYKLEDNLIIAIKVSTTLSSNYNFSSISQNYYIHFNKLIELPNNENIVVSDFLEKDKFSNVLEQYKTYLENSKIERGSIVKYEDKYIYIYARESGFYLGYRILELGNNDQFPIVINHKQYSALFDEIYQINKNDNFEIITTISEDEADTNRKTKKSYNKSKPKPEKIKKLKHPDICEGVIVCDITLASTEYIVLRRNDNELLTLMLYDNCTYLVYLNLNDVYFKRRLKHEEFRDILMQLKEKPEKYNGHMNVQKLNLLIEKYSEE